MTNLFENETPEDIAMSIIGQPVFTDWPFLIEARVLSIADELFTYQKSDQGGRISIIKNPHDNKSISRFYSSIEKSETYYSKRCGVVIGQVDITVRLEVFSGMQLLNDGSIVKQYASKEDFDIPVQMLVTGNYFDPRYENQPCPAITQEFPVDSLVFFLSKGKYGVIGKVIDHEEDETETEKLSISVEVGLLLTSNMFLMSSTRSPSTVNLSLAKNWQIILTFQDGSLPSNSEYRRLRFPNLLPICRSK